MYQNILFNYLKCIRIFSLDVPDALEYLTSSTHIFKNTTTRIPCLHKNMRMCGLFNIRTSHTTPSTQLFSMIEPDVRTPQATYIERQWCRGTVKIFKLWWGRWPPVNVCSVARNPHTSEGTRHLKQERAYLIKRSAPQVDVI